MRGQSVWAFIFSLLLYVVVILAGIFLLTTGAGLLDYERMPDAYQLEELMSEGDVMVAQIEAWNASHGRYPVSLEDAGIAVPQADYEGWYYLTDSAGADFMLSIGPYSSRFPFSLTWLTDSQEWYFHDR